MASLRDVCWACAHPATLGLLSAAACADGDRREVAAWRGTVDTLPGGIVRVANPPGPMWDSSSAWRLVEDLRIGAADGGGPDMFSDVHDIAIDAGGRIYVLQRQMQTVQVFDAAGRFVRTIGRSGSGPGEFEGANGLAFDPAGRLWVADPGNARFVAFDTAGVVLASHRRDIGSYGFRWNGTFMRDGRLVESGVSVPVSDGRGSAIVRFDSVFAPVDTLFRSGPNPSNEEATFVFRRTDGATYVGIPFRPASGTGVVDPRGTVWSANSGSYELVQHSLAGDTVRVVTRAYEPVPVTDDDLAGFRESISTLGPVDESRIPRVKPAFTTISVAPDGELWVRVERAHGAPAAFDVFDTTGRAHGTVEAPMPIGTYAPLHLTRDALYAVARDDDDVPYVVRLRIVRP